MQAIGEPRTISLGRFAGFDISAGFSAILGSVLLWVVLIVLAALFVGVSLLVAVVLGLVGFLLHWVADFLHQMGHALAARSTGHPMTGIHLWWVLSNSIYPPDEPDLPRSTHARRALGGPIASLLIGLVFIFAVLFSPTGSVAWWLALFFCLDNLLVFGLGAILPLGFTDGSTLLGLYRTKDM